MSHWNDYERVNSEEGWIALYWTIDDVDEAACMAEMGFEPELTHEEKMRVLEKVIKYHDAEEGVTWYTLQYWLYVLYGDREYHLENDEEDEE